MSSLERISWAITVGICMLGALALLLSGYQGYAALAAAVGLSAAINLIR
jgi:hypothetical protein